MIDAGVLLGLRRGTATDLAMQSALGAATLLQQTDDHVIALRAAVTSPAGATAAALRELERHRARAAVIDAVSAAARRSTELAIGSGPGGQPA